MEDPVGILHFSTDHLPERGRQGFEMWRETFGLQVACVDVQTPDPANFHADIRVCPLPTVTLSRTLFGGMCSVLRTPELLTDGDDGVDLVIGLDGRFDVRFGSDEAVVLPGQAILMPHHRAGGGYVQPGSRSCSLRLDRDVARQVVPDLDAAVLRVTNADDPALTLLRGYCDELMSLPEALPGTAAGLVGSHLRELLAHVLRNRHAIDIANGAGVRSARLRAVKADIAKRIDQPDLSIGTIAALHHCSPRYLQKLFEGDGTTFSDHVLAQRLARAHRLLTDPRRVHEKISAVAYDSGFANLSYFNRVFRRRYGVAPSDVRHETRRLVQVQ
jgi:AraC-like DNA-binding protein